MVLYKTSVKMVNMQVVRLTEQVMPHLIVSGTAGREEKVNTSNLNVKIICKKDKKIQTL